MYRQAFAAAASLAAVGLTACGGGGGGSSLPPAPVSAPVSAPAISGNTAISILIGGSGPESAVRRAKYVSMGTQSAAITVNNGAPTVVACMSSCSATVSAPFGMATFKVNLYNGPNATGSVLSTGSTTTNVVAGTNSVKLSFGGVVSSTQIVLLPASVTPGQSQTLQVQVAAIDAAGYTIVGSDAYATPVTLTNSDPSGATVLSTTSISSPSTPVTLSYSGATMSGAPLISASGGGKATLGFSAGAAVPVSTAGPTVASAANVPAHVTTWLYYGLNGINAGVPASYMVAKATIVETDTSEGSSGQNFKNAGGKYAVHYTDPAFVPYCGTPAGPCTGPIGNLGLPESGWLHSADGTRVNKYVNSTFGYQDVLNPTSPAVQAAYSTFTNQKLQAAPGLDFFFADDSGGPYDGADGTPASGILWNFSAPSVEITSDAQWIAGKAAVFAAAARPVIVNGGAYDTWLPAYNGAFLKLPNVAGMNHEGCFNADDNGILTDAYGRWQKTANSLLMNTGLQKYAVCMMMGAVTPAARLYDLASWWTTYDPTYSVAAPVNVGPDGYAIYPEFDIVPTQPKTTATSDISVLRVGSGAYVREFGSCYQAGASIGPCATVVNTTGAPLAMPALSGYGHALNLDSNGSYTGGKAWWSAGVPSSIAASSGVILSR